MKSFAVGRLRVLSLGALLVGTAPGLALGHALDCALPNEYRAFSARVLQTRMMVSALACDAKRDYNGVVTGLRPALVEQGVALKRYFLRSYGRSADFQLDRFTTRLANEESTRSTSDRAAYCAAGDALFRRLSAINLRHFAELLDDVELGAMHRVKLCSHEMLSKGVTAPAGPPRAARKATSAVASPSPRRSAASASADLRNPATASSEP